MAKYDDGGPFDTKNGYKYSDNGGYEKDSKMRKLMSFIGEDKLYDKLDKKYEEEQKKNKDVKINKNKNLYNGENYEIIKNMVWRESFLGTTSCILYGIFIVSLLAIILIFIFLEGNNKAWSAPPFILLVGSLIGIGIRYYLTNRMINIYEGKYKGE
jgi:hypothetical protein